MRTHNPHPAGLFYYDDFDALKTGRYGDLVARHDSNGAYIVHDPGYVSNDDDLHNRMRRQLGYDSRGIQNNNIGLSAVYGGVNSMLRH